MELLQMFGKLWRIKVWQGLNILEQAIEILTRFRRGRRCAKPHRQPIQGQHQPFSATRLDGNRNFWIAECVVSLRQQGHAFSR